MKSEQINELAAALSKAQASITGAVKDSANPFFKSKYADLASVMDAIRMPFAAAGLSYIQGGVCDNGTWYMETMLMHSSGQYLTYRYPIICAKQNDPQAFGAATTYSRRFALSAIAGVSQVDDDGNYAHQSQPAVVKIEVKPEVKPEVKTTDGIISEGQRKRLFAISKESLWTQDNVKDYIKSHGFESTKDISTAKYDMICDYIKSFPKTESVQQ